MSRAFAKFTFDDAEELWGIYDGTSDVMLGFMSRDQREPWDWYYHRGKFEGQESLWPNLPDCEHEGEHVIVYSDYGSGTYWHGKACRECMAFKGPFYYWYAPWGGDGEPIPYFKTREEALANCPG